MATKAKKYVHPMPKLGFWDQLLYHTVFIFGFVFSIGSLFLASAAQERIAFSDPRVISFIGGRGTFHGIWFMFWCLLTSELLILVPFLGRYPIFGRKGIKYGPPAYPRIYPLLMRNKPKFWVSKAEQRKKRNTRICIAAVLIITFAITVALLHVSFHGRIVLFESGSITEYDERNREINRYYPDELSEIELSAHYHSGRGGGYWSVGYEITCNDGESYHFDSGNFTGTSCQKLEAMLYLKEEIYGNRVIVSGVENLTKAIHYKYTSTEEQALIYRLFEVSP